MSDFFDDTVQGMLELISMENSGLSFQKRDNMPAETYYIGTNEKELIDTAIMLRKEKKITQSKLAELTGNKQQVISRIEKHENIPSLKIFCNILNALGYELQIKKKRNAI